MQRRRSLLLESYVENVIRDLTLEEKASLCSGEDFWHLKGIERLNISKVMVTDGPHGLRKQENGADHVGIHQSVKATCFPTASASACSWDTDLIYEMGQALGEECLKENIGVLLGPGVNIKRSPLCGRNFEYVSEDPYLSGKMGASFVKGVQSKGVGTSLKHFAANNQEHRRMAIDSVVDERALREIYLASFENVVKEADPWTVMCSYNKVNGTYASENKYLLNDILKEQWGHTGLVVTDWGATNDRVEGVKARLALEMPGSAGINDRRIIEAVKSGELKEEDLDKVVFEVLKLIQKCEENRKSNYTFDEEKHNRLARKVASESAVLLKNKDNILPLKEDKLLIIGEFARNPRYQGSGSSFVNPLRLESALEELDRRKIDYDFHPGYSKTTDSIDNAQIEEAVALAKNAPVVVVYAGLTEEYESEGFDREHIDIPTNQNALIQALAEVSKKLIVVLQNGSPISMPWLHKVDAVLECYLGGQAGGPASIDILMGDVNPSGKLAETFPITLEDDLASKWFKMGPKAVEYRESIYVGYRYYEASKTPVQFPFGFGLSYTQFEYSSLEISSDSITDKDEITLKFKIKNIGHRAGAETAQIYVKDIKSTIFRPEKELKAFKKVYLEIGEEKEVSLTLNNRAFAYYNVNIKDWHVESGDFKIYVAAASNDIRLEKEITVVSTNTEATVPNYSKTAPVYYNLSTEENNIQKEDFEKILGREVPSNTPNKKGEFDLNNTLEDISSTFIGKRLYNTLLKKGLNSNGNMDEVTKRVMTAMIKDMPIRSLVLMSNGKVNFKQGEGIIDILNGRLIKGIGKLTSSKK